MVLLNHDAATGRIEFRHYAIALAPSGVSRGVKALVGGRAVPALGDSLDVADFLTKSGYGSVRALTSRLLAYRLAAAPYTAVVLLPAGSVSQGLRRVDGMCVSCMTCTR